MYYRNVSHNTKISNNLILRMSLCGLGNALIILLITFSFELSINTSTLLLSFSFIILFLPVFFLDNIFHPIILFNAFQLLSLINFWDQIVYSKASLSHSSWINSNDLAFLQYALLIWTVWYIFLYFGYFLGSKTKSRKITLFSCFTYKVNNAVVIGTLLLLVSFLSFVFVISMNGGLTGMLEAMANRREVYSGLGYLRYLVQLGAIAAILFLIRGYRKTSVLIIIINFVMVAMFGGRGAALKVILSFLIFYHYCFKKFNIFQLSIVGLFGLLFNTVWGAVRKAGEASALFHNAFQFKDLILAAGRSTSTADNLGSLVGAIKLDILDYQVGKNFINILYAPIPRGFWEEKPIIDESGVVGFELMGNDYWGLPVGPYGWAYFNFSWFGVVILGLVTGLIVQKVYFGLIVNQPRNVINLGKMMFPFIVLPIFSVINTSSQITLIWYCIVFVLILLFDKLLNVFNLNIRIKMKRIDQVGIKNNSNRIKI